MFGTKKKKNKFIFFLSKKKGLINLIIGIVIAVENSHIKEQ